MKIALTFLAPMFFSLPVFANDPVTKIPSFQCHPRDAQGNLMVWTEKAGDKQIITLGTMGETGVEEIEKFTATRVHLDDIVTFKSNDGALQVGISSDFDGEFYSGDLTLKKDGIVVSQDLACEEYSMTPAGLL